MPLATARKMMIECQLRTNKVENEALLAAMMAVPREVFLPESQKALAYADVSVDLGDGRALLEPMVLARLIQALDIQPTDRVLNVACGTGYSAAVMAQLAAQVVALDSVQAKASAATANLLKAGVGNASVVLSYLAGGFEKNAPYQAILVEGSVDAVPQALFDQLAEGGRLVAVMQVPEGRGLGHACLWTKTAAGLSQTSLFDATVPVLPEFARKPAFAL